MSPGQKGAERKRSKPVLAVILSPSFLEASESLRAIDRAIRFPVDSGGCWIPGKHWHVQNGGPATLFAHSPTCSGLTLRHGYL